MKANSRQAWVEVWSEDPPPGYSGTIEHSSFWHSVLEHVGTYGYPIIFAFTLHGCLAVLLRLEALWAFLPLVVLAWAASDVITGTAHWMFDNYFSETTPVLGSTFVRPFRAHHLYPRDICKHDVVLTIGNTCIAATPLQGALLVLAYAGEDSVFWSLLTLFASVTIFATVLTNLFHRWAHAESVPAFVRVLQRLRLILPGRHHDVHHVAPHDRHYCITCGWMDRPLEWILYFSSLEKMIAWFGVLPVHRRPEEPAADGNRVVA